LLLLFWELKTERNSKTMQIVDEQSLVRSTCGTG
jgi:hypothetical protein